MDPRKLQPGQPLEISAAEWNRHVEASDAYHRARALGITRPASALLPRDKAVLKVKNLSGAHRRRGEVLELAGTSPLADLSSGMLWLDGRLPQQWLSPIVVLLTDVDAFRFADGQIEGVCRALVNVLDTQHEFAVPRPDSPVLVSSPTGSVHILKRPTPSTTGEQECVVRLTRDHRLAMVQVHHTGADPGQTVEAQPVGGIYVHPGIVIHAEQGALQSRGNCYLLLVDEFDTRSGQVSAVQDDYYGPAIYAGEWPLATKDRPLYLARKGGSGGTSLVVFQLDGTLSLKGSAPAKVCELSGGVYAPTTQTITVKDWHGGFGMWAGLAGYRGLAQERSDGLYDIVFMERAALVVKFTTVGNRSPTSSSFVGHVEQAYQHGDRPPPGMDTSGNITIYDAERLFPRALDGGKGVALWNDVAGQYQCLVVQQQCLLATAYVGDTGGMNGNIGYVTITGFQPTTPSPWNLAPSPAPTQALNAYGHMGKYGDQVQLAWDEFSEEWVIVDVARHRKTVYMGLRVSDAKDWLQAQTTTCALEYVDEPTWQNVIPLKQCGTGSPS
jgi:hypothetical protein